jgi:hypothetical protein
MRRSLALTRRRARWMLPILVLGAVALTMFAFAGTAAADTIQFEIGKGGTNADGSCESFEPDGVPAGKQVWQFNLTQTQSGATMSASFSDGTTVTNKAEDDHNGKTSKWFIQTDLGAKLDSASATFTPDGENSQFVVSHCTAGETPQPPTPAGPPGGEGAAGAPGAEQAGAGQAGAAQAVTARPRVTG